MINVPTSENATIVSQVLKINLLVLVWASDDRILVAKKKCSQDTHCSRDWKEDRKKTSSVRSDSPIPGLSAESIRIGDRNEW